jgi:hypothetical protein
MPSALQSFVSRGVLQLFLSPYLNGGAACILRLGNPGPGSHSWRQM